LFASLEPSAVHPTSASTLLPRPPQSVLRTARLLLRPHRAGDAADLIRHLSERAVADGTLNVPHPYPPERAAAYIAEQPERQARGKGLSWAVTWQADGRLVGGISLALTPAHRRAELGYWIAKDEWGAGIATEASRAVIAYAFDVLVLQRVDARHYAESSASGAVMRRVGMHYEGRLRHAVWRDGVPRDLELYAMLHSDPRPYASGTARTA